MMKLQSTRSELLSGRVLSYREWWGAGVVICLERGADLHMAQLMPLPLTVSCSNKIQIGFTFLGNGPLDGCMYGRVPYILGWLGSGVVSVLDSGAEGPGFNAVG